MIALQLYTVRELLKDEESVRKTLSRIKQIGYEGVQLACAVPDVRMIAQTATALGLQVLGFLGGVEQIENEADVLFSSLREVGASVQML